MTGARATCSKVRRTSDVRRTSTTMQPEQVSLWLRENQQ